VANAFTDFLGAATGYDFVKSLAGKVGNAVDDSRAYSAQQQQGQSEGTDWLAGLVGAIPVAGSWLESAVGSVHNKPTNQSAPAAIVQGFGTNAVGAGSIVAHGGLGLAGSAFSTATSADPTQLIGKPIANLVGQGDSEWDTGALGLIGNAFDKGGRLVTYASLTGAPGRTPGLPNASQYNKRAWQMAFSGDPNHVRFGEAILGDQSLVTDPSGLSDLRKQIAGTWYGAALSGALDFAMYSAIDPTRGVGKAASSARYANFVEDASKADTLANKVNAVLDTGGTLPKPNLVTRTALGSRLSDEAMAGYQFASKSRFDNLSDINHIINEIDPNLGVGGGPTKSAIPAIAEMYSDAAKATSDILLQRQIKLNIDYALTGSQDAMDWLATNYPGIAAKGNRMSHAPSEFTLLEDVLDDYASKGNDLSTFNLNDHVTRYYSDPVQQAELTAYGAAYTQVADLRKKLLYGGSEGGPVEFGTTVGGVQIVPRNLEKIKTFINNKVGDDYLFQTGPTGRTIRVITSLTTPGAHGFINLVDPVLGNRQLVYALRDFADHVPGVDDRLISMVSDKFLRLAPAQREDFVRTINDHMLNLLGVKHGLDKDQMQELLRDSSQAYLQGRVYALDEARKASASGETYVSLGDLGGTDTVLDAKHLISHLSDNSSILDYKTADAIVRSRIEGKSLASKQVKDVALKQIAQYHQMWKHAQLGRLGLIFRVLMDTDLRANAMIGTSALAMEALNGTFNFARNQYLTRTGSAFDEAISSLAHMQATSARHTIQEVSAPGYAELAKGRSITTQIARADELADIFKARQRQGGRFHAQTNYYKQQEASARALADRQRQELSKLQDQRSRQEPFRQVAEQSLSKAEERYLTPEAYKKSITTKRKTYESDGVQFTTSLVEDDMQRSSLLDEVRGGSQGLSSLLLNDLNTRTWEGRVEKNHWSDHVDPKSPNWPQKYALAVRDILDSPTAKRMLVEGDGLNHRSAKAYVRSFLDDPAVKAEFKSVTGGGTTEEFMRWINDIAMSVDSMTQNPALKARLLQGKLLTPKEVEELAPSIEDRFPIFGPNIVHNAEGNIFKTALDRWYRAMVDLPDVYLARIPAAVGLYDKNVKYLLPKYAEAATQRGRNYLLPEEARDLHLRAKGRALNDARRDMYDIHRRLGAEGAMRYIAPFFAPWYDAMQSWARLIYDDPSRLGMLMRYAQTPDMFNLTTNQDGVKVNPWDDTPLQDKRIRVPLLGVAGLDAFNVNFGSMNTITQGNTPFSPGAGPLAQIAGTAIVADVAPKAFDGKIWGWLQSHPNNVINQTLFMRPGDIPKGDIHTLAGTQLPSWMRTLSDAFLGSNGFGNTYTNAFGTRYNDLIRQYREAHGGADPSADELKRIKSDAQNGAKAAALARSITSFNLGVSGTAAPEGQFYVDKMHALVAVSDQLHAIGLTPEQVFAQNYPSASNLNWSFSENDGNLQATVNATTNYMRHRKLMDDHPDVMWWIAGPDNIVSSADPNSQFSQGAYNEQMTLGLRRKYTDAEFVKQSQIAMGQGRYNAFQNALRLYMAQNGVKSLNSSNAGNLSGLKANYVNSLRAQFPEWATYFDGLNSEGLQDREIDQIRSAMQHGNSDFNSRPDVRLTQQYLTARDAVIAQAQNQGIVGWRNSSTMKPARDILHAYGQSLARKDIVFAQAWDRLFEHEFNSDLNAARQQALFTAVGR
jgi:hypothetical protein